MKNLLKKVLSVAAATALLMTSVISASAEDHSHTGGKPLNAGIEDKKGSNYTITLTYPSKEVDGEPYVENFTKDNSHYGAYQIFSGTVKGTTSDPALNVDEDTNNKLPITDIKWGSAFGDFDDEETKKAILEFVYALATASTGDYGYAFKNFTDFKDFYDNNGKLNSSYTTGDIEVGSSGFISGDVSKVNFDKLAVAVADILAQEKHVDDHEWLQAFTDILGGYAQGSAGSYINKNYATQYYEGFVGNETSGKVDSSTNYTIYVPAGYYMIRDLSTITDTDTSHAFSARMLFVANNINQVLKVDVPTLDKEILRDGSVTGYETDAAGVGDVVHFQLKGTLPSNYDEYLGGYQYTFIDTLSKGLDLVKYDDSHDDYDTDASTYVKVTVKGLFKKLADGSWEWDSTASETIDVIYVDTGDDTVKHHHLTTTPSGDNESSNNYDTTYDSTTRELKVKFTCLGEIRIKKGTDIYRLGYDTTSETSSEIYVDYYAKVNQNAVIKPASDESKVDNGNINQAQIEYSDNPQAYADTDKTVIDEARVYTFGLDITKIDAAKFLKADNVAADAILDGAKFVIVRPNPDGLGGYQIAKITKIEKGAAIPTERSFEDTYYSIDEWESLTGTDSDLQNNINTFLSSVRKSNYEVETADGGKLLISGLNDSVTYTMVETETPDDDEYAKIDPFTITLTAAKNSDEEYTGKLANATSDQSVAAGKSFSYDKPVEITDEFGADDDGSASMLVANFKYTDLPSTGGIGVYIYYIAGGCIVALALVLFALSKKKKTNK